MSPGGGELSLSVRPGVGNRTSSTQMPGGVPGGGMVTGRIEPRITGMKCHTCTDTRFKKPVCQFPFNKIITYLQSTLAVGHAFLFVECQRQKHGYLSDTVYTQCLLHTSQLAEAL